MEGEYHNKKNTFLKEMSPRQFDTIPHIIIWALVFILDIVAVFLVTHLIGIPLPVGRNLWGKIGLIVYLCIAFVLFCLESFLYNLFRD